MILKNASLIKHNGAEIKLIKLDGIIVYEKPGEYYVQYTVDNSKIIPLNQELSNGLPMIYWKNSSGQIAGGSTEYYERIEITLKDGTTTTDVTTTCDNISKVKVWWDPDITAAISFHSGSTKLVKTLDYLYSPSSFTEDFYPFFQQDEVITSINASNWVFKQTTCSSLFSDLIALTTIIGIEDWDVSNATDMSYMFSNCKSLTTLDLSDWDVHNVTNMQRMFDSCYSLATLNLSNWTLNSSVSFSNMFGSSWNVIESLADVTVEGWNYSDVNKLIAVLPKGTLANGNKRILRGNETVLHEIEEPDGWEFRYY